MIDSSEKETILEAVFRVSAINTLARIFGYFKNVAIAVLLGFNLETDAFFMAIGLIGIFLVVVDVFDSVGIPQLVKAQKDQEEFIRLAGILTSLTTALAVSMVLIAIIGYPWVSKIAVGFAPTEHIILKKYFFALIPYLLFSFFFHHFGAILRSQRSFTPYFTGELIFAITSFILILGGLTFYKDALVLPVSISIAQLIATLYIVIISRRFISFIISYDAAVQAIIRQFFSLTALYGVVYIFMIVDKAFASILPTRSISALSYGYMIAALPRGIFRLENILITPLSEVDASPGKFNYYIGRIMIISGIIGIFIFLYADLIVHLLLGYGAFSHVDEELTITTTRYYAFCVPLMFLWPLLYRVLQIKNYLGRLIPAAVLAAVLNLVLNYVFVVILQIGLTGIILGTIAAYSFLCLISYYSFLKLSN